MRPMVIFLAIGLLSLLAGEALDLLKLGYIVEEILPVVLGFLLLFLLKVLMPNSGPAIVPLKDMLWRNVVHKIDDRPPVRLDVRKGFYGHSRSR